MSWHQIDWVELDYVTEIRLDWMQGNADHLHDALELRPIISVGGIRSIIYDFTTMPQEEQPIATIETDDIAEHNVCGTGAEQSGILDLGQTSVGMTWLTLRMDNQSSSHYDSRTSKFYFYRSADIDYLYYYIKMGHPTQTGDPGTYFAEIKTFSVYGVRA